MSTGKNFDLRYNGQTKDDYDKKFEKSKPSQPETNLMQTMLGKYFGKDKDSGFGLEEISETVYDVIASQRRDEELQNEVRIVCEN